MENTSFTTIGNCQSGPLSRILLHIDSNLSYTRIKPIHTLKRDDWGQFTETLRSVSFVFHQPIGESFREYSIASIKSEFSCPSYISYPSLYFKGYHPWLMYLRLPSGGTLRGILGDYHDERVVESFLSGYSVSQACEALEAEYNLSSDFYDREFLKLRKKEKHLDCKSWGYIYTNFRETKLFHTMNHPSNAVLVHVARQLLKSIGRAPSQDQLLNVLRLKDYLSTNSAPIAKQAYSAGVKCSDSGTYTCSFEARQTVLSVTRYIEESFRYYSSIPDLTDILAFAHKRRQDLGF